MPNLKAVLVCLCCALAVAARAEVPLRVSSSRSGQFMVPLPRATSAHSEPSNLATNRDFVRLDPTLLPVSCERVKDVLSRQLEAFAPWRGRIFLTLYPVQSANDPITIASERFRDGWQYKVALPDVVERPRLVRALVEALLLEMANRSPGTHAAEIPAWLTLGLTRQVLESSPTQLILEPPRDDPSGLRLSLSSTNALWRNPLSDAHERLVAAAPLTIEQLSWPGELQGAAAEAYGASAQLFVAQLLALRDGPACLRALLADLPQHYNWQFAFFHAFHAHFSNILELEKWWALQTINFTGRDLTQTWPKEESWAKLDEVMRSAIQVRLGTNQMPLRADIPLQTVLREWDTARQTAVLRNKVAELELLRPRFTGDLVPLVDDYCRVLREYLQERDHPGFVLPLRKAAARRHAAVLAVQQLDTLDARRAQLKPKSADAHALASETKS